MVKRVSLSPQAELEARLQYLSERGYSGEKTIEEIFGPLESWTIRLGNRSLLLNPLQKEWLYWDAFHETWETTSVAVGEGEFFVEGDRLNCRWKDPTKAQRAEIAQSASVYRAQAERETSTPAIPPIPPPQPAPPSTRRSPWAWIFSFGGMVVSCISLVCGGMTLLYGLTNQPASGEEALLSQTQVAVSSTMTARALNVAAPVTQNTLVSILPTQILDMGLPQATQLVPPPVQSGQGQVVSCPGAPPTHLAVGGQAHVGEVGGYSLTIFAQASYEAEELYYLEEGAPMLVIGGPVCLGEQLWWQVSVDQGNTGWVPETSQSRDYLLEP